MKKLFAVLTLAAFTTLVYAADDKKDTTKKDTTKTEKAKKTKAKKTTEEKK